MRIHDRSKLSNARVAVARVAILEWMKLGAAGIATVLLSRWVPDDIVAITIVAGAVMTLGALIWARVWVIGLVPRDARWGDVRDRSKSSRNRGASGTRWGAVFYTAPRRRRAA